jgi:aminobenzoyl-glutamate transport protein
MCNYDTVSLGILTQAAARVDVDSTYTFNIFSSIYIMIVSTIILTIIGNIIIMKVLYPKLPKEKEAIEEDLVVSKKALGISNIAMIIMIIFIAYGITPKIFGGGFLLDKSGDNYISMLLSDSAPFKNSIIFIITFIIMVCGYIYGKISKNINNSTDYSVGLSKSFDKLGYVFVLSFFASQMVAILDWTGIDDVLCSIIVDLISKAQFSGLPLILITMLFLLLIGIIMPNTYDKWVIISPIMVPLFMRSNIAPEFTQFIFQVVDGVSKSISPIFMYFIILLAFLEKYSKSETKITVFGTIKTILPTVLLLLGVWILIITGWYIIGLPLGVGTSITL